MPKIRLVAALLHSDDEIVGTWQMKSSEECKAISDEHLAIMNDPTAVMPVATDAGLALIPVAHIEYLSFETES